MEKQRNKSIARLFKRLLISFFFCLFHFSLYAAISIPSEVIEKLRIVPEENQSLITDKDIKYSVIIPGISPSDVEVSVAELQDNTQFKTLRRTRWNENDTRLELWYEFQSKGNHSPSPLKVTIQGKEYSLKFAEAIFSENQLTAKPVMIISFANGIQASEKNTAPLFSSPASKEIIFSVSVRNAKEIINTDYQIPLNELLVMEKKSKSDLLGNQIYVAHWTWTPLVSGKTFIPEISIKVRGNDGELYYLKSPEVFINVTKKAQVKKSDKSNSFFSESFSTIQSDENLQREQPVNAEELLLQKLRNRKNRLSKILIIFLVILILGTGILFLLKIKSPFPYLFISIFALILLILFGTLSKKKTAVYTNGTIKSIPEENGGTTIQIAEFSEIKILKETKDWYCIQVSSSSSSGWTKKENVRFY